MRKLLKLYYKHNQYNLRLAVFHVVLDTIIIGGKFV